MSLSRRAKWIIAATLPLLGLIAAGVFLFSTREPKYNGKPLSAWLKDFDSTDQKERAEAEAAIKRMGTNAVPFLSNAVARRDSAILRFYRSKYFPRNSLSRLRDKIQWHLPVMESRNAATALSLLGPAAREAIPELAAALRDPSPLVAGAASQALIKIGQPAVPTLLEQIRAVPREEGVWAVRTLAGIGPAAAPAAREVARFFDMPAPDGDFASVALAQMGPLSARFVTNFLQHTDVVIRVRAITYFDRLGTNGKFATNLLLSLTNDPSPQARRALMTALWDIEPGVETLRPFWIGRLSDPDPTIAMAAVQYLSVDVRAVSNELAKAAFHSSAGVAAAASNYLTMFRAWPKKEAASNSPAAVH